MIKNYHIALQEEPSHQSGVQRQPGKPKGAVGSQGRGRATYLPNFYSQPGKLDLPIGFFHVSTIFSIQIYVFYTKNGWGALAIRLGI